MRKKKIKKERKRKYALSAEIHSGQKQFSINTNFNLNVSVL